MANYLYVDNSNSWIEGMHVAAVVDGVAPDVWTAQQQRITSPWRMDFGRLFEFAGGTKAEVARAVLYGSRPPANDSLWDAAKRKGFRRRCRRPERGEPGEEDRHASSQSMWSSGTTPRAS
jgi:hypothetical protein